MKKILSLVMTALLILSVAIMPVSAEADKTLKFGEDGKFRILQFADIQDTAFLEYATYQFLKDIVAETQPDLIVLTGDNIAGSGSPTKTLAKMAISRYMSIFEKAGIPVAMVFGNHDSEGPATKEDQMAMYQSYDCFVGSEGEDLTGCGNYNLPIYSADGEEMLYNLWMIDSLTYNRHPEDEKDVAYYENDLKGYACVHKDQIDWYVKTSNELKAANGGEPVPSMAFQHIIVPEIYDVLAKDKDGKWILPEGVEGELWEDPCPPHYSNGQFDAMLAQGDVVAMFFGHDHKNDFIINNQGIDLVNTPGVGFSSYGAENRGARIIDLDVKDLSTYETEVIDWVDFYDVENNTTAMYTFIIHGNEFSFGEKLLAFVKLTAEFLAPIVKKAFELVISLI